MAVLSAFLQKKGLGPLGVKDIPRAHLLLKFGPKTWKSPITCTCLKLVYCQIKQVGPLGVKPHIKVLN